MKVTGVIDEIRSRSVSNGGTVYEATIDGSDVNLGFQCDYQEGEYVDLEVESTKWGLQVPRKGGKPRSTGTSASSKPAVGTGATNRSQPTQAATVFPVNPNSKDHSIIRQNALTNANAAVKTAGDLGLLKSFKTKEELYNEVIQVAYNLAGFAMGTLDAKLVEELNKEAARQAANKADKDA